MDIKITAGMTETNLRDRLETYEGVSPCVLTFFSGGKRSKHLIPQITNLFKVIQDCPEASLSAIEVRMNDHPNEAGVHSLFQKSGLVNRMHLMFIS